MDTIYSEFEKVKDANEIEKKDYPISNYFSLVLEKLLVQVHDKTKDLVDNEYRDDELRRVLLALIGGLTDFQFNFVRPTEYKQSEKEIISIYRDFVKECLEEKRETQ